MHDTLDEVLRHASVVLVAGTIGTDTPDHSVRADPMQGGQGLDEQTVFEHDDGQARSGHGLAESLGIPIDEADGLGASSPGSVGNHSTVPPAPQTRTRLLGTRAASGESFHRGMAFL